MPACATRAPPAPSPGSSRRSRSAAVLPLWTGDFPPLTDLPQHAAQISVLRHWGDPACGYPELYEIRWLTPNGLAYALAWALVLADRRHDRGARSC